jgi:hypothetical protein
MYLGELVPDLNWKLRVMSLVICRTRRGASTRHPSHCVLWGHDRATGRWEVIPLKPSAIDEHSLRRVSSFSALSNSSRAFSHCSRVPVVIVFVSFRPILGTTWCLIVMRYI